LQGENSNTKTELLSKNLAFYMLLSVVFSLCSICAFMSIHLRFRLFLFTFLCVIMCSNLGTFCASLTRPNWIQKTLVCCSAVYVSVNMIRYVQDVPEKRTKNHIRTVCHKVTHFHQDVQKLIWKLENGQSLNTANNRTTQKSLITATFSVHNRVGNRVCNKQTSQN